jgi:hypothetical protein
MQFNNGRIGRCLVLVAAVYFLVRGPWRAIHDSGDFLTAFAAARCWIGGLNPYATGDLVVSARAAGAQVSEAHFLATPSVYPPPTLLLFAPLAVLPWELAKGIWLACTLGVSCWAAVALTRMAKGCSLAVWSFLLAFAPLHTGIAKGQPGVLVCALIVLGIVTPRPYIAGLLLGIAVCIKPQLVLGFVLLVIVLRQGRKLVAASTAAILVSAAAWMCMKPGSFDTWISNLSAVASTSANGSPLNPLRFQLLNIDTLVPQALYGTPVIAIVYAIIASVSAIAVLRAVDTPTAVAVVASAALLVGYHRFYDAQVLWLGIPAMLLAVEGRMSLVLRAGYSVFLIPGQTMAATWFDPRPDGLTSFLLLRHETLACVVMWLIFAAAAIRRGEGRIGRALANPAGSPAKII